MEERYYFLNRSEIIKYDGQSLKKMVGSVTVETVINPSDEALDAFGYKLLDESAEQLPEAEGKTVNIYYELENNVIHKKYEYIDIPSEEE